VSTTDPNSPSDPTASSASRAPGDKLAGCYALSRKLDVGVGTEVWLAHDEVLGKDVSLHFVPEAIRKDTRALQELRQDIKRNRQLIHPNILRVYDLVEEPDWVAISMDAFEGESIAARLGRQGDKPSTLGEIQPWADRLAQTLEEAHKINVLHRDLTPANLFLTPGGKLLVANFGISRTISDALTRAGAREAAAVAYESPQLLEGKLPMRTDDIYSLGAILFRALTGKPPFTGPDLAQKVKDGVSAENLANLGNADLSVPASWRTTVEACLSKNPEARPQSGADVARRLAVAESETAATPAPGPASAPAVVTPASPPVMETPAAAATPVIPAALPVAAAAASMAAVAEAKGDPRPASSSELKPAPAAPAPADIEPKRAPEAPELQKPAETPDARPSPVLSELKPAAEPKPAPEPLKSTGEPLKSALERTAPPKSAEPPASEPRKETAAPKPAAPKGPDRPYTTAPRLYPEESRFPVTSLAVAAVVLIVIGIIYHFATSEKQPETSSSYDQPPEKTDARTSSSPAPEATPVPPEPKPPVVQATPANTPTPPPAAAATPSPASRLLAEKTAALEKARSEAQAAEKAEADLSKQQEATQASLVAVQKSIDDKMAASKTLKKAADDLAARRKKLEDNKKAADAAAAEAQKAAAEKARLAEESAKALADLDKANAEKMAAPQQTDTEVAALQKDLEQKQHAIDDGAKALAQAEATKRQKLAAVTEQEQEIEHLKSSDAEKMKQQEAEKTEKAKLDAELEAMRQKIRDIENKRQQIDNPGRTTPAPGKTPQPPAMTPVPATPAATVAPLSTPRNTPRAAIVTPAMPTPIRVGQLPSGAYPPPLPEATPGPLVAGNPGSLALNNAANSTPSPSGPSGGPAVPGTGANSLGMKFAPVGDVEFCIWQTRVKDFEIFAAAVHLKSTSWKGPGFKQGPDHPVVNVSWVEAMAFCKWLTDKEHKEGTLPANEFYRLPTDLEWSKAVGLPEESGKTPEVRDMGVPDVYPWGTAWPPPPGAGNYTGEETGSDVAIKGYDDGFAWTSPVGSFPPNKYGLYDMGGNVWQWCMDTWNSESKAKVLRGASWYNGALKLSLLSSCRVHAAPDSSTDNYGFRIVRVKEDSHSGRTR